MASPEQRALQSLSTELFRLDRQILALVRRQEAHPAEDAARVLPGGLTGGDRSGLVPPHPSGRQLHASPPAARSLGAATPKAQQALTATPAHLHLLQPSPGPARRTSAPGPARRTSAPAPASQPSGQVFVIGSSIVHHVKLPRTSVSCFPGARVLDIARRLPSALRRNTFETGVIHVGTNDISARRSEVLKEHYHSLLDTARKATDARIVISGPLPTYRRGSERFSRLFTLQSWLRGWCAINGLGYVDNWASFWEQPALYRRDGLHPSHRGAFVLSRNIERAVR